MRGWSRLLERTLLPSGSWKQSGLLCVGHGWGWREVAGARRVTKRIFCFQGNTYSEAAFNPQTRGIEWQWVLPGTPSGRVGGQDEAWPPTQADAGKLCCKAGDRFSKGAGGSSVTRVTGLPDAQIVIAYFLSQVTQFLRQYILCRM